MLTEGNASGASNGLITVLEVKHLLGPSDAVVMRLPPYTPEDRSEWKHLLQQGSVDTLTDLALEFPECPLWDFLETLPLDLSDVDPPEPQTLFPDAPEQLEVHPIALLGLTVQTGDEVESGQQFGKSPLPTLPAMLVDQSDCGPELLGVAVQPVLLVHSGIGRLQAEREHCAVGQGLDQCLGNLRGRLDALGDD